MRSVGPHFLHRHLRIPGLHFDSSNRVAEHTDGHATAEAVEGGRTHAVIGRKPTDEEFIDAEFVQGRFEVPPVFGEGLEAGVRVHFRIHPLRPDYGALGNLEVRMESRPLGPLDAMRRPGPPELFEMLGIPLMPDTCYDDRPGP